MIARSRIILGLKKGVERKKKKKRNCEFNYWFMIFFIIFIKKDKLVIHIYIKCLSVIL